METLTYINDSGDSYTGEIIFTAGKYTVLEMHQWGRYTLIKHGKAIAWKNKTSKNIDFYRWIEAWEKNALKQIERLEFRITDLRAEQDKFRAALQG